MNLPALSGQHISGHLFVRMQIQKRHPEGPKSDVQVHENCIAVNPVLSRYIHYTGCRHMAIRPCRFTRWSLHLQKASHLWPAQIHYIHTQNTCMHHTPWQNDFTLCSSPDWATAHEVPDDDPQGSSLQHKAHTEVLDKTFQAGRRIIHPGKP